jgi:hypothetical protein
VENGDGGIAHYLFDDPAELRRAIDEAEADEWHLLRDGGVYCTATKCEARLPACVCPDGDCNYRCPVGCPCLLHGEITVAVLPGQLEIGGGS